MRASLSITSVRKEFPERYEENKIKKIKMFGEICDATLRMRVKTLTAEDSLQFFYGLFLEISMHFKEASIPTMSL